MSEWPKEIPIGLGYMKVVPADLARELYEALKGLRWGPTDRASTEALEVKWDAALARYEREVGR